MKKLWLVVVGAIFLWLCLSTIGFQESNSAQLFLLILLSLPLSGLMILFGSTVGVLLLDLGLHSQPHLLDLIFGMFLLIIGYIQWFWIFPKLSKFGKPFSYGVIFLTLSASLSCISFYFKCGDLISMCSELGGHLLTASSLILLMTGLLLIGVHIRVGRNK